MSQSNGDKARFQKDRKRKLRQRERNRVLATKLRKGATTDTKDLPKAP